MSEIKYQRKDPLCEKCNSPVWINEPLDRFGEDWICPKCGKIETIVYQDDIFSEIKTVFMDTIAHISLFSCIMMAILVVIDPQKPYIVATFIFGLAGMILLMFKK